MTPEEAKRRGFKVTLTNPTPVVLEQPTLQIQGLTEAIQHELVNSKPDHSELVKAIRSISVGGHEELIEAVKSINVSNDMTAVLEALNNLNFEMPKLEMVVEHDKTLASVVANAIRSKQIIVSADVEHEWDRGFPVLKRVTFNYGDKV